MIGSLTGALLRVRLRAFSLLLVGGGLLFVARNALASEPVLLGPQLLLLLLIGSLAGLLWTGRPLELLPLRSIEVVLFGSILLYLGAQDYQLITRAVSQGDAATAQSRAILSLLHYAILIAGYGIFVPNSWRRAAAVVIPMALAPLAIGSLLLSQPAVARILLQGGFASQLADSLLLLLISVALAVYGTYVISRYRIEAAETRDLSLYQLEHQIGQGGMGEIWLARHRMLARPVALKVIRPEHLGGPDPDRTRLVLERFNREAQATASLRSAHTVELYDFGITGDGSFFYVMEYLDGLNLETLVERFGPVDPERAVFLLKQACQSLGDAHRQGLVHRDVKPSNIYACRMGLDHDFVKVLDFGLVKSDDGSGSELTQEGLTTGTPAFMAPEMVMGGREVDGRADIYSLGAVGYWLLTGRLVFEQTSAMAMAVDHVRTAPQPPSRRSELEVPAELDRIILRCLEKKPGDRFPGMEELAAALDEVPLPAQWDGRTAEEWWSLHLPRS